MQRRAYRHVPSAADTIFALASGAPPSGVAVIRTSGPRACAALADLAGRVRLPPRELRLVRLADLDSALVAHFPRPRSFTGEDVVEYHVHGGLATVRAVCAALAARGLRAAARGEFTRRAVVNGRMDLAQAAALGRLVAAETDAQRVNALRGMSVELGAAVCRWRAALTAALAHADAVLDFGDDLADKEGDLGAVAGRLRAVRAEMLAAVASSERGERVARGARLVIYGPPNAGKSSLLNALAQRSAALVSAVPGTTRDVVEVALDLFGLPVAAADTAGLRETTDAVERMGVDRARDRVADADVRVLLLAADAPLDEHARLLLRDAAPGTLVAVNKADAVTSSCAATFVAKVADAIGRRPPLLSSLEGAVRLDDFMPCLKTALEAWFGQASPEDTPVALVAASHAAAVTRAANAISRALDAPEHDMAAQELRSALAAVGELSSPVDSEEVLDNLFSTFCIGK